MRKNGDGVDAEKVAAAVGFSLKPEDEDGMYDVGEFLEKEHGVFLTLHCSYDYPMHIIGTEAVTAYRGTPMEIKQLPEPTAKQRAFVEALQKKLGGKIGVWLASMYG